MKIAIINDTHFGARSESQEVLAHQLDFYTNQFFPYLKKHKIKTLCHLGDFVDRRKFIQYNILNSMKDNFMQRLCEMDIETHILVGNHDAPFRNSNEVNAIEELFKPFTNATPSWKPNIWTGPMTVYFGDCPVLMLPWINMENEQASFEALKNSPAEIVFGHLEIKGFEMYRGFPSHEGFDKETFQRFKMVCSGHFHRKSNKGNIYYLGAPYEMTWNDYDDPRGFHIFDTETHNLTHIKNTRHLFYKIMYDDSPTGTKPDLLLGQNFSKFKDTYVKVIVIQKINPYTFDQFMGKLYEAGPADITVVEDHLNVSSIDDADLINQAEDTLTILSKYIDGLEGTIDKVGLDKLMRQLYSEAINLEAII